VLTAQGHMLQLTVLLLLLLLLLLGVKAVLAAG
jgi:hypothetical protein